jgi:hypothetical protein
MPELEEFVAVGWTDPERAWAYFPTEVFAVDQAGGLAGQLVAPFWKRISAPNQP